MILNHINTKEYLDEFEASLENFLLDIFNHNGDELQKRLEEGYDYKFAKIIRELLKEKKLNLSGDKLELEKALREVKDSLSDVSVLEVSMAFTPTERFLGIMRNWVKDNVSQNTILDIKVKQQVIAGAVMVYKGVYKDYSMGTKLQNYKFNL